MLRIVLAKLKNSTVRPRPAGTARFLALSDPDYRAPSLPRPGWKEKDTTSALMCCLSRAAGSALLLHMMCLVPVCWSTREVGLPLRMVGEVFDFAAVWATAAAAAAAVWATAAAAAAHL